MTYMNHLSTNLKKLRTHHGLSQEQAAEALGIKRSRYSGWEGNMSEPNIDMLLALSKLYRMSLDRIIKADLASLTKEDITKLMKP
jgi:transcriptional regulator with XRE-family HTH domain